MRRCVRDRVLPRLRPRRPHPASLGSNCHHAPNATRQCARLDVWLTPEHLHAPIARPQVRMRWLDEIFRRRGIEAAVLVPSGFPIRIRVSDRNILFLRLYYRPYRGTSLRDMTRDTVSQIYTSRGIYTTPCSLLIASENGRAKPR